MWLVFEVRKEQHTISRLLEEHPSSEVSTLSPLISELRWQLGLAFLLLAVLIASAIMLIIILREYFYSQRSLKNLEQQATDILESMEHGILTCGLDGRIVMCNRNSQRILGIESDPRGNNLESIDRFYADLDLNGLATEVLETGEAVRNRESTFKLNNHQVVISVDSHLLRGADGRIEGTVHHLHDITREKMMQDRMIRMEGYMGLGPVAAGLHHEIKNPLSALSIHVRLLEERLDLDPGEEGGTQHHIDVLKKEIQRIGNVLESLRDYAKVDALSLAATDLVALVREVIELMEPEAGRKSVELCFDIHNGHRLMAMVDRTRLAQIVLNLILNALHAMESPGKITVDLSRVSGFILLSVTDEGTGIHPSAQQHIFDPYFTTKKDGVGMGLAVCRKIARLHGGDLQLEIPEKGTRFILKVPVKAADGSAAD